MNLKKHMQLIVIKKNKERKIVM